MHSIKTAKVEEHQLWCKAPDVEEMKEETTGKNGKGTEANDNNENITDKRRLDIKKDDFGPLKHQTEQFTIKISITFCFYRFKTIIT